MAERQRTPDEIRAEIEQTRADMDETVQAISYRLSPGQIVDQMWDRVRTGDAAASFAEVVKEHPVPAMLMGLGLGWLMYERTSATEGDKLRKKFGDIGPGTYAPAEGRVGPYMGEDALSHTDDGVGMGDRARSAIGTVRDAASSVGGRLSSAASAVGDGISSARESVQGMGDRASELRSSASERMDSMRTSASERVDSLRTSAAERVGQAKDRTSELAGRAKQTVTSTYEEQPLALGALAFGIGLASGLAVPATPVEDRMVGERADRLKDEVKHTASEKLEAAKRVASEARDAAKNAVQNRGVMDVVKEQVRSVVEETRTAAMQAAEREGLTTIPFRQGGTDAANRVGE